MLFIVELLCKAVLLTGHSCWQRLRGCGSEATSEELASGSQSG